MFSFSVLAVIVFVQGSNTCIPPCTTAMRLPSTNSSLNMAGAQEKRKPFQGKKFHKDLRDYKNQEIKRSLVHRARLRKNYFKLLESEDGSAGAPGGERVEKEQHSDVDSDSDQDSTRRRAPLPPQRAPPPQKTQQKPQPKRVVNFAERAKLAKERKEKEREAKIQRVQERRHALERQNKERERKKESLSKRTKSGQPVMGPKISDLLDKIRQNSH